MDLSAARELKQHIRRSAIGPHVAVGISLTSTPGAYRVAILLQSRDDYRLLDDAAAADVDVEIMGEIVPSSGVQAPGEAGALLRIGASVGHCTAGDGSLGFFARQRSTGRVGLVSCNHTIALADRGADGDIVISPSGSWGGRAPRNGVAILDGRYPRLAGRPKLVDCAFAYLLDGIAYDAGRVDGGTLAALPAPAVERLDVMKIGSMTNARPGVVAKIEVDNVPVRYGAVKAFFNDVIQIAALSETRFATEGDSGALVYTARTFQPIGLLFATSYAGGPYDAGWTWAHPIEQVTEALGVDIVVS